MTMPRVLREELPEIYQKAGNAAARSQKRFLAWSLINFTVLALAAVTSLLKSGIPKTAAITGAALLASGAMMSFWLRKSRYERRWYSSRAVAESVKTLAWRYMMCATPFEGSAQSEEDAARRFNELVQEIAMQEAAPVPKTQEITVKMREVRQWPVTVRAELYRTERIEHQRVWYAGNSEKNERLGQRVLWFAVGTQIVACGFSLVMIATEKIPDLVGVFATISAGFLAWMQVKKYEDLAQAYVTAAKELSRIGSGIPAAPSDAALSRIVLDAENAISREHTLWWAKRV